VATQEVPNATLSGCAAQFLKHQSTGAAITSAYLPEQPLGLTVGTSELFAKADFGTLAVINDGADLRNRVPGSTFGGE
jgi:hypothetical protein